MSMIGKALGNFTLEAQIGKGGMGEVYRAKDQKLGRDVAIKVLPEEFAKDADRVARFQREAKLLASLNHPNIAAIHGLEESDGIHFLVLELIEGDTLADRIKGGPIPVEESLKLALQIAEALEAAHEKGVIHRDLKPANIKVTPDGKVKVLDFGLAKAFAGESEDMNLSNSPTLSAAATQQGVILGTAAYMSPEQAKGKSVDKRADIWAFGCVLFEMLTGRPAIQGEDVSEILASVIKGDTNLKLLPGSIHPKVPEIIASCLEKDLKKRYRDIGDVKLELEKVLADADSLLTGLVVETGTASRLKSALPLMAVAAMVGLLVAGIGVWYLRAPDPGQVTRFSYDLPEEQKFIDLTYQRALAVSPDGRQIVYSTTEGLYIRSLNDMNARPIEGSDKSPASPFFSPDGNWIAYWSDEENSLKKIAVSGGTPINLCNVGIFLGGHWGADNRIIFGDYSKGVMQVSANGGDPKVLIERSNEYFCFPQMLPDGKSILYTLGSKPKVVIQSLESGERKELDAGFGAQYLPSGYIVYALDNSLFAVSLDLDTLEVTGGPAALVEGVSMIVEAPQYAVSQTGLLTYIPGSQSGRARLEWYDRQGNHLESVGEPAAYGQVALSPNEKRAVVELSSTEGYDLWIVDLDRQGVRSRFTTDAANERDPVWSPDGKSIVFNSDKNGLDDLYMKSLAGDEEPALLYHSDKRLVAEDWSDDGRTIAYKYGETGEGSGGIMLLSMPQKQDPTPFVQDQFHYDEPEFSPDGKWMAYVCDESGRNEVYIRPLGGSGERIMISSKGGGQPQWREDERELFYLAPDGNMMSVELKGESLTPAVPKILFQTNINAPDLDQYAVTHDGKRFLIVNPLETQKEPSVAVVLNWFEELKERVPVD